jgi:hypothetical protein
MERDAAAFVVGDLAQSRHGPGSGRNKRRTCEEREPEKESFGTDTAHE